MPRRQSFSVWSVEAPQWIWAKLELICHLVKPIQLYFFSLSGLNLCDSASASWSVLCFWHDISSMLVLNGSVHLQLTRIIRLWYCAYDLQTVALYNLCCYTEVMPNSQVCWINFVVVAVWLEESGYQLQMSTLNFIIDYILCFIY